MSDGFRHKPKTGCVLPRLKMSHRIHRSLYPSFRKAWSRSGNQLTLSFFQNPEEAALSSQLKSLLQASSTHSRLQQGKQVHAQYVVNGIARNDSSYLVGAKILGMYVDCDSFLDGKRMFYEVELGHPMAWNWMIRGFVKMGRFDFALLFYFKMLGCGVWPDKYTFPAVVKACGGLNDVRLGRMVHGMILEMGFDLDAFVGSALVNLYAENGSVEDARSLFDEIPQRDCVSWNVMLNGFVKCGKSDSAIRAFMDMRYSETKPDSSTFVCVLSVCASEGMIEVGTQVHGLVICCGLELESPVANTLVSLYSKCRQLSDARNVFNMTSQTDLVTWNVMISGYVQNGCMDEALHLFQDMVSSGVKPDTTTFTSFLPSVTESASIRRGKEIHGYIVRQGMSLDVFLKSALIDVYSKCRDAKMAHKIFNQNTLNDVVVCTAMISGYVLNGMNNDALEMFRLVLREKMKPNAVTLASVLPACAGLVAIKLGKELHANIIKCGLDMKCLVGSAILDMYAKCGRLDLAHEIFTRMPEKDSICWNSMITSCSRNGHPKEAIDLFRQMGNEGMRYDGVSISAALSACANLPALKYGKEIHSFMIRNPFCHDFFAESALVDMYAKCGNLNIARSVFDMIPQKNEVSWNNIIAAYGYHGLLQECLALFHKMLENGIKPDHVTFLGIISACGHAGQVDEGIRFFHCMTEEYGVPAIREHYASIVDLFGRAGRLNEAFETIRTMPFSPDAGIWGTLLGACRMHRNTELAEVASRHLLELDPQNSGYYVLLSNMHADSGQWWNAQKTRGLMKERGVQKIPGYSWIEVNKATHKFLAADGSHPESAQIYSLLKSLLLELRKEGYAPQSSLPLHPQACRMQPMG